MFIRRYALFLLLPLLIFGCKSRVSTQMLAPDFQLKDLAGKTISLKDYRGHPVLLDFWATWCGPCRMSIPIVEQFYAKHKGDGLVVLGMNVDDDPSGVPTFVKEFHMTYPVVLAGTSQVYSDYQVEGIPTFVLIDPQGNVVDRFSGFREDIADYWESDLRHMHNATNH